MVTWTYKVTSTGNVAYTAAQVVVTDTMARLESRGRRHHGGACYNHGRRQRRGFGSNDKIQVANALAINALLFGGNGNDMLGGRRDILIGGAGSDTITGNSGDYILIGGATPYDANTAANTVALDAIMNEWASHKSFSQRVYYLTNKTAAPSGYVDSQFANRLNGGNYLQVSGAGKNLADDAALDS